MFCRVISKDKENPFRSKYEEGWMSPNCSFLVCQGCVSIAMVLIRQNFLTQVWQFSTQGYLCQCYQYFSVVFI